MNAQTGSGQWLDVGSSFHLRARYRKSIEKFHRTLRLLDVTESLKMRGVGGGISSGREIMSLSKMFGMKSVLPWTLFDF